jgi:hypothetical protein
MFDGLVFVRVWSKTLSFHDTITKVTESASHFLQCNAPAQEFQLDGVFFKKQYVKLSPSLTLFECDRESGAFTKLQSSFMQSI